jgi:hypothetical protein
MERYMKVQLYTPNHHYNQRRNTKRLAKPRTLDNDTHPSTAKSSTTRNCSAFRLCSTLARKQHAVPYAKCPDTSRPLTTRAKLERTLALRMFVDSPMFDRVMNVSRLTLGIRTRFKHNEYQDRVPGNVSSAPYVHQCFEIHVLCRVAAVLGVEVSCFLKSKSGGGAISCSAACLLQCSTDCLGPEHCEHATFDEETFRLLSTAHRVSLVDLDRRVSTIVERFMVLRLWKQPS